MICSRCGADKPENEYPQNYGKRNGSTCLACRRNKYKTRVEVARSKIHAASPKKKCSRCIEIWVDRGLTVEKAKVKAAPVIDGNYYFCYFHFALASKVAEEYQGW